MKTLTISFNTHKRARKEACKVWVLLGTQ